MSLIVRCLVAALLLCALCAQAAAARKTVCTITVNSDDEREVLKKSLPADDYDFVELVARGRPDWLASACERKVSCDVLVISGHFDGGTEFYTDRLDARESLPVAEMERVACSESCPALFTNLKEVYLFGCNTLNAEPMRSASSEVARSLVRAGHSPQEADDIARTLSERHGESNRDRMRHIFKDVPVIYGFPGKAPLGRIAGPLLERYLTGGGAFAAGKPDPRLLATFAASGMTVTAGMTDGDARAGFRHDVCQFADDRLSPAQKMNFVHALLDREAGEVRMFLDHIERYATSLAPRAADSDEVKAARSAIVQDTAARERFLDLARDADEPATRVRMTHLAKRLGWITAEQERSLLLDVAATRLAAANLGPGDVELACTLNKDGALDGEIPRFAVPAVRAQRAGHAAVLACLGSSEARGRVLRALAGGNADDAAIAQAYLVHRPLADAREVRLLATDVARMSGGGEAQVRALHALARHQLSDPETITTLTGLFPVARTVDVQRAIANVLIRADYQSLATTDFARTLRAKRLKSPDGRDVIDALIRRLDAAPAQLSTAVLTPQ